MLLPQGVGDPIYEDGLLDLLISHQGDPGSVSSMVDAKNFVAKTYSEWHTTTAATVVSGIQTRLAAKLILYNNGIAISDDSHLSRLLQRTRIRDIREPEVPLVLLVSDPDPLQVKPLVYLRVPAIGNSEASQVNLAALINLACAGLVVDRDQIRLAPDPSLGTDITIPTKVAGFVERLGNAFRHPKGVLTQGRIVKIPPFEGNVVEILGCMRTLSTLAYTCRSRPNHKDGRATERCSYSELAQAFYTETGITKSVESYAAKFFRALIQVMCRSSTKLFPGGVLHAAKERCKARDNEQLLYALGWKFILPNSHKVISVLTTKTQIDDKGRATSIKPMVEGDVNDIAHARAAAFLLLPYIDPKSELPMKDQVQKASACAQNLAHYKSGKMPLVVDMLDSAFAFRNHVKAGTGRSSPAHFQNKCGQLISSCQHLKFVDRSGKSYGSLGDIPDNARRYLQSLVRYPVKDTKRKVEDSEIVRLTVPTVVVSSKPGDRWKKPKVPKLTEVDEGKPKSKKAKVSPVSVPEAMEVENFPPLTPKPSAGASASLPKTSVAEGSQRPVPKRVYVWIGDDPKPATVTRGTPVWRSLCEAKVEGLLGRVALTAEGSKLTLDELNQLLR